MKHNENPQELPLGLSMALAQDRGALERFSALTDTEQADVQRARSVRSKAEMQALVISIAPGGTFF